jgi:hypothetical protein
MSSTIAHVKVRCIEHIDLVCCGKGTPRVPRRLRDPIISESKKYRSIRVRADIFSVLSQYFIVSN